MKKISGEVLKLIISAILFFLSLFLGEFKLYGFFISYIIISFDVYKNAFKNIKKGQIFDENFLMIIATIGAFIIDENMEAVLVIWLFELGEYLADLKVDQSKDSILELMDQKIEEVYVKDGKTFKNIALTEVKEGDIFGVKPGEKIPLDGILLEGNAILDTSFITGESALKGVKKGDVILSGCLNVEEFIVMKSTTTVENTLTTKILDMMKNIENRKAHTEKFITRFASIYTPIIVFLAILLVIIPTLLGYDFNEFLYKALVFLVTSCPCALVLSVPLAYFCAIGSASRKGILIKGGLELENLSKIDIIALDKTGTLTKGVFRVTEVSYPDILEIASYAEFYSNHPIAKSIVKEYSKKIDENKISNYKEVSGKGVICNINEDTVLVGNSTFLKENDICVDEVDKIGSIVYVSKNGTYLGYILVSDELRSDAEEFVQKANCPIYLLSGDNKENVDKLSKKLKIQNYYASLLPNDKVSVVQKLKEKGKVLFIGDGMNDAPVMRESDLSISMGHGSDLAIESSDIVLLNNKLMDILFSIQLSKRTMRIIHFNIVFALITKFLMLILGLFGITSILGAVMADVGVTLLSVLNTLRLLQKK